MCSEREELERGVNKMHIIIGASLSCCGGDSVYFILGVLILDLDG